MADWGDCFFVCCLCIIVIVIVLRVGKFFPNTSENEIEATATVDPMEIYLDDIGPVSIIASTSTQPIDYPESWPRELLLPDSFVLVEAYVPRQFEGDPSIWASKYIFAGEFEKLVELIKTHFQEQGWNLLDNQQYYENVYFIVFDRPSEEYITILIQESVDKTNLFLIQINAYVEYD